MATESKTTIQKKPRRALPRTPEAHQKANERILELMAPVVKNYCDDLKRRGIKFKVIKFSQ